MKKYVIVAAFVSSLANAEIKQYDNPNVLQCGPATEIVTILKQKYGETISFAGSSRNKVKDAESVMFFFLNKEATTYTFVNFYPVSDVACIVDAGTFRTIKQPELF